MANTNTSSSSSWLGSWFSWGSKRTPVDPLTPHQRALFSFLDTVLDYHGAGDKTRLHPTLALQASPLQVQNARQQMPERLVCIGDLHGDIEKTKAVFQLAGLTDKRDSWVGGTDVCVQVGDQLDRGDDEVKVLYFLERLKHEARLAGGALHVINGNHETMNVNSQFRYSTQNASIQISRWLFLHNIFQKTKRDCGLKTARHEPVASYTKVLSGDRAVAARYLALRPGGPLTTRFFADQHICMMVGGNLFVHAGLLPQHVQNGWKSIEQLNASNKSWMLGLTKPMPSDLQGRHAVVWTREFSSHEKPCDCDLLTKSLRAVAAERMIVGHTIYKNIRSACEGRVVRIDVGMSKGCWDNVPQALEIVGDRMRVLV